MKFSISKTRHHVTLQSIGDHPSIKAYTEKHDALIAAQQQVRSELAQLLRDRDASRLKWQRICGSPTVDGATMARGKADVETIEERFTLAEHRAKSLQVALDEHLALEANVRARAAAELKEVAKKAAEEVAKEMRQLLRRLIECNSSMFYCCRSVGYRNNGPNPIPPDTLAVCARSLGLPSAAVNHQEAE